MAEQRLDELRKKHRDLATKIEDAHKIPGYDFDILQNMKKKKHQIKEEIEETSS